MKRSGDRREARLFHRVRLVGVMAAVVAVVTNVAVAGPLATPARAQASTTTGTALFGAWAGLNPSPLGLATAGSDLGPTSYLPGMIAWQGRNNGVLSAFGNINDTTNAFGSYFPKMWNTWKSVPMYSIVENQHTNEEVVAGSNDAGIKKFGVKLDAFINGVDDQGVPAPPGGRRVFLRPYIEPNSVVYPNYSPLSRLLALPVAEQTCENLLIEENKYVAAWRYTHDMVMAQGTFRPDQVHWIFNTLTLDGTKVAELPMPDELRSCANGASDIMERLYPGDDYVDSVSMDGFHYVNHPREPVGRDLPGAEIFAPMHARIRAVTDKPIGIDEVGASTMSRSNVNVKTPAEKDQWLKEFYSYVQAAGIRRVIWDNLNGGPTDWSVYALDAPDHPGKIPPGPNDWVDQTKSRGTATFVYESLTYNVYTEYKNGINAPYFEAPDPANPRLVSDEAFRGLSEPADGDPVVPETSRPALMIFGLVATGGVAALARRRRSVRAMPPR